MPDLWETPHHKPYMVLPADNKPYKVLPANNDFTTSQRKNPGLGGGRGGNFHVFHGNLTPKIMGKA